MKNMLDFFLVSLIASMTNFVNRKNWSGKKLIVDTVSGMSVGGMTLLFGMKYNVGYLNTLIAVGLTSWAAVKIIRFTNSVLREIPDFTMNAIKDKIKNKLNDFLGK